MIQQCMNSVYWCLYMKIWKCHRKADHLPEPFLGGIYTAWKCMYKWANSCTIALLITIRKAVQARMYLGGTFNVVLMYNVCTCLYNVCTRLYNVCTCATHVHVYTLYVHVYTLYVHVYTRFTTLTSCLNRFSWPSQRCRCPSALLCKGRWGWGQSLSGRWWFFYARPDAAETEGVWNRSQNCAGASCVPDVIHSICQNTAFMEWIQRYCT